MAAVLPPLRTHLPLSPISTAPAEAEEAPSTTYGVWLQRHRLGTETEVRVLAGVAAVAAAASAHEATSMVEWRDRSAGARNALSSYRTELSALENTKPQKPLTRRPSAGRHKLPPPVRNQAADQIAAEILRPQQQSQQQQQRAPANLKPVRPPVSAPRGWGGSASRKPVSPPTPSWTELQGLGKAADRVPSAATRIESRRATEPPPAPPTPPAERERRRQEEEEAARKWEARRRAAAAAVVESRQQLLQLEQEQAEREAAVAADPFLLWPRTHRPSTKERSRPKPASFQPTTADPPVYSYVPWLMMTCLSKTTVPHLTCSKLLCRQLQNEAAARIQRLQKCRNARREVQRRKKRRAAATRIQASERGRQARAHARLDRLQAAAPPIQRGIRSYLAKVEARRRRDERSSLAAADALPRIRAWRVVRKRARKAGEVSEDALADALHELRICYPTCFGKLAEQPAELLHVLSHDLLSHSLAGTSTEDAAVAVENRQLARDAAHKVIGPLSAALERCGVDAHKLLALGEELLAQADEEAAAAVQVQRVVRGRKEREEARQLSRQRKKRERSVRCLAAVSPKGSLVRLVHRIRRRGKPSPKELVRPKCRGLWLLSCLTRWGSKTRILAAAGEDPAIEDMVAGCVQIQRLFRGFRTRDAISATISSMQEMVYPAVHAGYGRQASAAFSSKTCVEVRDMVAILRKWYREKRGGLYEELTSNFPAKAAGAMAWAVASLIDGRRAFPNLSLAELLVLRQSTAPTGPGPDVTAACRDPLASASRVTLRKWVKWVCTLMAACYHEGDGAEEVEAWVGVGAGGVGVDQVDLHRNMRPGELLGFSSHVQAHRFRSGADKQLPGATRSRPGTILIRIKGLRHGLPSPLLTQRTEGGDYLIGPGMVFRVQSVGVDARNKFGEGIMVIVSSVGPLGHPLSRQRALVEFFAEVRRDAEVATRRLLTASRLPPPRRLRVPFMPLSVVASVTRASSALRSLAAAAGLPVHPAAVEEEPAMSPRTAARIAKAPPPAPRMLRIAAGLAPFRSWTRSLVDGGLEMRATAALRAAAAGWSSRRLVSYLRRVRDADAFVGKPRLRVLACSGGLSAVARERLLAADVEAQRAALKTPTPSPVSVSSSSRATTRNVLTDLLHTAADMGIECAAFAAVVASAPGGERPSPSSDATPHILSDLLLSAAEMDVDCGALAAAASVSPPRKGTPDTVRWMRRRPTVNLLPALLQSAQEGGTEVPAVAAAQRGGMEPYRADSIRRADSAATGEMHRRGTANLLPLLFGASDAMEADCFAVALASDLAGLPADAEPPAPPPLPRRPTRNLLPLLLSAGEEMAADTFAVAYVTASTVTAVPLSRQVSTRASSSSVTPAVTPSRRPTANNLPLLLDAAAEMGDECCAVAFASQAAPQSEGQPQRRRMPRRRSTQNLLPFLLSAGEEMQADCLAVAFVTQETSSAALPPPSLPQLRRHTDPAAPPPRRPTADNLPLLLEAAAEMGSDCFAVAFVAEAERGAVERADERRRTTHAVLPLLIDAAREMGCDSYAVAWLVGADEAGGGSALPRAVQTAANLHVSEFSVVLASATEDGGTDMRAHRVSRVELGAVLAAANAGGADACAVAWASEPGPALGCVIATGEQAGAVCPALREVHNLFVDVSALELALQAGDEIGADTSALRAVHDSHVNSPVQSPTLAREPETARPALSLVIEVAASAGVEATALRRVRDCSRGGTPEVAASGLDLVIEVAADAGTCADALCCVRGVGEAGGPTRVPSRDANWVRVLVATADERGVRCPSLDKLTCCYDAVAAPERPARKPRRASAQRTISALVASGQWSAVKELADAQMRHETSAATQIQAAARGWAVRRGPRHPQRDAEPRPPV
eukprot:TRINITY_DN3249_c0_g1_i1.p1 TRINITY_DN3249_c0_g1~~TRINITY_DN3249_c0_g1_i1.p1  ORF type:complete len:1872 (+),score=619.11 TRINITY_DN3249_c0_g1_i1:76-5691(+)